MGIQKQATTETDLQGLQIKNSLDVELIITMFKRFNVMKDNSENFRKQENKDIAELKKESWNNY